MFGILPLSTLTKKRIRTHLILKENFWDAVELFVKNHFHPSLKTHKLTGKLYGLWAFSAGDDCRIVFKFFNENKSVLLINIGTHYEVY